MRDRVREIYGAVDGIDHPAVFGIRVPGNAFLAEERGLRRGLMQRALDHFLAANVQLELDIVLAHLVGPFSGMQMSAHQRANRSRGASRRFESSG
jgi:hypothetical protein